MINVLLSTWIYNRSLFNRVESSLVLLDRFVDFKIRLCLTASLDCYAGDLHSNPSFYLCHVGNSNQPPCWLPRGRQVSHQRWFSGNIDHIHLCQMRIRLPTLVLKPRGDVTRSKKKSGYQWLRKRTCVHPKFLKEKLDLVKKFSSMTMLNQSCVHSQREK